MDDSDANLMEAAAAQIRDRGWSQGRLRNDNGAVCISGALALVRFGDPLKTRGLLDPAHPEKGVVDLVETTLYKSVLATLNQNLGTAYTLLSSWNDRQERKQFEVVNLLREAAARRRME